MKRAVCPTCKADVERRRMKRHKERCEDKVGYLCQKPGCEAMPAIVSRDNVYRHMRECHKGEERAFKKHHFPKLPPIYKGKASGGRRLVSIAAGRQSASKQSADTTLDDEPLSNYLPEPLARCGRTAGVQSHAKSSSRSRTQIKKPGKKMKARDVRAISGDRTSAAEDALRRTRYKDLRDAFNMEDDFNGASTKLNHSEATAPMPPIFYGEIQSTIQEHNSIKEESGLIRMLNEMDCNFLRDQEPLQLAIQFEQTHCKEPDPFFIASPIRQESPNSVPEVLDVTQDSGGADEPESTTKNYAVDLVQFHKCSICAAYFETQELLDNHTQKVHSEAANNEILILKSIKAEIDQDISEDIKQFQNLSSLSEQQLLPYFCGEKLFPNFSWLMDYKSMH